jgi:regulator of sigma D
VTTSEAEATVERRSESHRAIQKLVDHRTQMLSLYGELAAHRPYTDSKSSEYITNLVQRFCQALIDYTADAHFRLYRFVDNNKERRASVSGIAEKVYPQIEVSTQVILDFNDKYDVDDREKDLTNLERDLSVLGEKLADRIEQEDLLVDVLSSGRR